MESDEKKRAGMVIRKAGDGDQGADTGGGIRADLSGMIPFEITRIPIIAF
jgi:hypothetical protein